MADIKNLNTISSSKYDIYTKLLDIAAAGNYTSSQDEFKDTDFLISSQMGYVTESMAMAIRDSAYHKTMIYRELFLNTAVLPKSVYNWAKMFNINCIDAIPSARYATFMISLNDIANGIINSSANKIEYKTKYGIKDSADFIVLDKNDPIVAGNYYFSLEHSIAIFRSGANNSYNYYVKHCLNELEATTNYGVYPTDYINSQIYTENNLQYLIFTVKVYQYRVVETSKIISGSTFLDVKSHDFTYDGEICGLSLVYEKGNISENVELRFSNIDTSDNTVTSTKIAYYSLVDENTINITFTSNKLSGLPQSGGILKLKTYQTLGYEGNISYNGNAVYLISQEDFKTVAVTVTLDNNIITSGVDQSSLQEIKNKIITELSVRNTIITENDLNVWFDTQSKLLEDVNNSKITFIKEKDNFLKRTFAAYLLLRDGVALSDYTSENNADAAKVASSYISSVVPTNTIDITKTFESQTLPSSFLIKPADDIEYDNTTSVTSPTYNVISESSVSSSDYIYKTPFYILVNTKYNNVAYFYLSTVDSSKLNISNIEYINNDKNIIPNIVTIKHNDTGKEKDKAAYNIEFEISSNIDLSLIQNKTITLSFNDVNQIVLSDDAYKITSVDSTDTDSTNLKTYKISVDSYIEINDNMFNTSAAIPYVTMYFGSGETSVILNESAKIGITISGSEISTSTTSFLVTMKSESELSIFNTLSTVMNSDITINKDSDGNIVSYVVKAVPVVAKYWFTSTVNKEWFIKQLFIYINMLKENSSKLETTTFFNIKFRNTYGISRYFNVLNTAIRLKMKIYLKQSAINTYINNNPGTDIQSALEDEIRDYIRILIDKSNEEETFVLSKVIMQTQAAYYTYIEHIDFLGLNGTFNQYIKHIDTTNFDYPLEYISLDNTEYKNTSGTNSYRLYDDIIFEVV